MDLLLQERILREIWIYSYRKEFLEKTFQTELDFLGNKQDVRKFITFCWNDMYIQLFPFLVCSKENTVDFWPNYMLLD